MIKGSAMKNQETKVIHKSRKTKETDISLNLLIYGSGNAQIQSENL